MAAEQPIPLTFRRGGDWVRKRDERYLCRHVRTGELSVINALVAGEDETSFNGGKTSSDWEYALLEWPDPEPLKVEGCGEPQFDRFAKTHRCFSSKNLVLMALGSGPTLRAAIEAYNSAVETMRKHNVP